jgi:NAD(P)-dependent dehydrogenase (short-subunit alcohol dehydrogenase family)
LTISTIERLCHNQEKQLRFLVHRAGIINLIKPVLEVTAEELYRVMNTNCEAPFFLTTGLYPFMCNDTTAGRVLHVSSGAAHGAPPVGWSTYGITKAAFFQSFKALEREFREAGGKVDVGSLKPGVVDTTMHGTIHSSSDKDMLFVQTFKNMKENVDAGVSTTIAHPLPRVIWIHLRMWLILASTCWSERRMRNLRTKTIRTSGIF